MYFDVKGTNLHEVLKVLLVCHNVGATTLQGFSNTFRRHALFSTSTCHLTGDFFQTSQEYV